jgi:hypothetical protein
VSRCHTDMFGGVVLQRTSRAWCWRTGAIGFGRASRRAPKDAFDLGCGSPRRLRDVVSVNARHAYEGRTLLVPGVPEAPDDVEALAAAKRFAALVQLRMAGKSGWPVQQVSA